MPWPMPDRVSLRLNRGLGETDLEREREGTSDGSDGSSQVQCDCGAKSVQDLVWGVNDLIKRKRPPAAEDFTAATNAAVIRWQASRPQQFGNAREGCPNQLGRLHFSNLGREAKNSSVTEGASCARENAR
jgi:hypothetical protein